jgi:hypothetical protein
MFSLAGPEGAFSPKRRDWCGLLVTSHGEDFLYASEELKLDPSLLSALQATIMQKCPEESVTFDALLNGIELPPQITSTLAVRSQIKQLVEIQANLGLTFFHQLKSPPFGNKYNSVLIFINTDCAVSPAQFKRVNKKKNMAQKELVQGIGKTLLDSIHAYNALNPRAPCNIVHVKELPESDLISGLAEQDALGYLMEGLRQDHRPTSPKIELPATFALALQRRNARSRGCRRANKGQCLRWLKKVFD